MPETIKSSMFSRRASICVYFGMTGNQITRSVLIGIPARPSFLSVPWSFCRTSVPILIVSLHNLLLSTCNSFFRIGPALVSLGSGVSLIYFWYARDALCFFDTSRQFYLCQSLRHCALSRSELVAL